MFLMLFSFQLYSPMLYQYSKNHPQSRVVCKNMCCTSLGDQVSMCDHNSLSPSVHPRTGPPKA